MRLPIVALASLIALATAEPITLTLGATTIASFASYYVYNNYVVDCKGTLRNYHDFETRLDKNIRELFFGQHIVESWLPMVIKDQRKFDNPNRMLAVALHGSYGTGKSFISRLIADSLFVNGMDNPFVLVFSGNNMFDHTKASTYQSEIYVKVKAALGQCSRTLVIMEETDKMPLGVVNALSQFIGDNSKVEGVKYNAGMAIFVTNTGASAIDDVAFSHYHARRPRTQLTNKDFERALRAAAYNEVEGGLKGSEIITRNLIRLHIPFLPMTRNLVKMCVVQEVKRRGQSDLFRNRDIDIITDSMSYNDRCPEFSISGCRNVDTKVMEYGLEILIANAKSEEL